MPLEEYRQKREFSKTPEPAGEQAPANEQRRFVIQRHQARRLHYDLRLELYGVLKSWAVPKGPSLNPADKQLAVQTEDHPLEYLDFHGVIPEGNYGAGVMEIWDHGEYIYEGELPPDEQFAEGDVKLLFKGKKIKGGFALVRMKPRQGAKQTEWLLIKHKDQYVDPDWDIAEHDEPLLVHTGDGAELGPTAGALEGAVAAPFPEDWQPMLATQVQAPFDSEEWLFEPKWDGMRVLGYIREGKCRFISRNGNDATGCFPELAGLPLHLRLEEAVVDGEVVVLEPDGTSSFGRLQHRMHVSRPTGAQITNDPVDLYLFDILYADGDDLRGVPLLERKHFLEEVFRAEPPYRYSHHLVGQGRKLHAFAKEKQLEGIIAKRLISKYLSGRRDDWLKVKILETLDAVIMGFTDPRGGRMYFGALCLALYDQSGLRFVGSVGTGFDHRKLKHLHDVLLPLIIKKSPVVEVPKLKEKVHWTEPKLIARVTYSGWTRDERLRHPVFVELRSDIGPQECRFEAEAPEAAPTPAVIVKQVADPYLRTAGDLEEELFAGGRENVIADLEGHSLRFTNLNKVYFPEKGITKRNLLAHYYRMAPHLLPMLEDRPMVLRRHPNGIHGETFYQKEIGSDTPDWMPSTLIYSDTKKQEVPFYVVRGLASLLFLTNLGCIEHNPWTSRAGSLEQPDYVFFDLDPTEGTQFKVVVEIARFILMLLQDLGAKTYLKTSGASGLHIYLPLQPRYDYDQSRSFAEVVLRYVASKLSKQTTLERHVAKRSRGQVYLDYSQNSYGRPLASVYSARPVTSASISAPLCFEDLTEDILPSDFTIETMPERLQRVGNMWEDFWTHRQRIEPLLERLMERVQAG